MNILITYGNRQCFLFQAHSVTFLTGCNPHIGFIFLFYTVRALSVSSLQILYQAFKYDGIIPFSTLSLIVDLDFSGSHAIEQHVLYLFGEFFKRLVQTEFILFGQCLQHGVGEAAGCITGSPSGSNDRPFVDTFTPIRND